MSGHSRASRPLSRRRRFVFRLLALLLAWGVIELIASRMERLAPMPDATDWAVGVIRRGENPFRYRPHPYALYRPEPRYAGWSGLVQHNRLGFRGREVAVPKPPGAWRIVCLGDSATYGTEVQDPAASYPAQLEDFLRGETGQAAIEVVNAGFPGATSAEVLQTLAFRVWPLEPDVVVLAAGINDSVAIAAPGYRDDYAHVRHRSVLPRYSWATRAALRLPTYRLVFARSLLPVAMFQGWRVEPGPEAGWQVREPTAYAANTESALLVARARGVRPIVVTPKVDRRHRDVTPLWAEILRRVCAAAEEVALRRRAPLCRYHDLALPDDVWADAVHLGVRGERLKAEFVGRELIRYGLVPLPSKEVPSAHGQG